MRSAAYRSALLTEAIDDSERGGIRLERFESYEGHYDSLHHPAGMLTIWRYVIWQTS